MVNMVVDIIVPVYNVSKYLNKCIESLLAQTYKYIKIILVDDGSTDGSEKICDNYARIDDRINVIHKENGGLVSAWTMGIKNSKSEWVVFVDGDDWVEYKHIELLVKEQIESSADIVVTRMKQIDKGNEKFIEFCVPEGRYIGEKLKTELHPVMINAGGFERRGVPFSRCSKLIRKSIIIRNLKYSYEKATYEEDFNIIAPCLMDAKAISMLKVEGAAYCYRKVESSMLHGYDRNMSNSIYHIYPILLKACKSKNMGGFVRQIQFEYVSAVVRLFLNETKNSEGYINMSRIIKKYLTDRLFQQSLEIVDAGIPVNAFTSSEITANANSEGSHTASIVRAVFAPTPLTPSKSSNIFNSSRVLKPKILMSSSLTL